MPSGGARKNHGRGPLKGAIYKPTLDKALAREELRKLILSRIEPMTRAQMRAAEGLNIAVVRRPDGTFRRIDSVEAWDKAAEAGDPIEVQTLQPSTAAYTDLLNRALDKPIEPHEHEHTGAIEITINVPWLKP